MKQNIRFNAKSVYGNVLYYPANAEAMAVCKVAGVKTLDLYKINTLRSVFEVTVVEQVSNDDPRLYENGGCYMPVRKAGY